MDILENNKKIAEFLGLTETDGFYTNSYDSPPFLGYSRTLEELGFHSSWDWLIPVINKILFDSFNWQGVRQMKKVQDALISCDIDKAYNEVVIMIELLEIIS